MPLEALIKEIESEASKAVSQIKAEQKSAVDEIIEDSRARARDMLKNGKEGVESELERRRKQQNSSVDVERNMLLVEAREKAIERELKVVRKAVATELSKNYMKRIIDSALKEFSKSLNKNDTTIITRKANAKLVEKRGYKVEYDNSVNGFILSNKDRTIMLNAEIERIVDGNMDVIRNILSKNLFKDKR